MSGKKGDISKTINIKNKQAKFQYEILDTYKAGLVLKGTEIKSIRQGKVSFVDGYCYFHGNELYARGVHISPYQQASFQNHEPDREKKLLLNKNEISKLQKSVNEKGTTIVPLRLYITDRGFAKLEIAVGKGKKLHDKRESLKEKDHKREIRNLTR